MKRHLRPSVQKALIVITILCFPFLMINDFELRFAPFYLLGALTELTSIYLLIKYGKGLTDDTNC